MMPVDKRRFRVSLEPALYDVLKLSAEKAGISLSLKARDLIKEALTTVEDSYWYEVAKKREQSFISKKALSHKDIWDIQKRPLYPRH